MDDASVFRFVLDDGPLPSFIHRVTRCGDWYAIQMSLGLVNDAMFLVAYARIVDKQLLEWAVEPPPCFLRPAECAHSGFVPGCPSCDSRRSRQIDSHASV